jgi:mRNA interferase MazF
MLSTIYSLWNILKQKIEIKTFIPFFHEKEIWWIYMGKNIGFEQDGEREKKGKFYFDFTNRDGKKQTAILSQMRPFSSKRLKEKLGEISESDFIKMKKKIKKLF